jgi:hypothetical protein
MTVRVSWDNDDKTVIHYQFDDNWTWDDFFPAKARAQDLIDTVPHKVAVILETQHNGVIPHNLLTNARNGLRTKHPQTALVVIVVTRPFIRTMIGTIRALSPLAHVRIEMAYTMAEARATALQFLKTLKPEDVIQSDY